MLFAFRGIRLLQVLAALGALVVGVTGAIAAKGYSDGGSFWLVFGAAFCVLVFFWLFATALRAPTSYVAISEERTRIRFAGFVDTVIDNRDVLGARMAKRGVLGGVGVRTTFRGDAALVSAWGGPVAELHLRRPIRVWVIPRLIPVRATRLQISVRNPAKLVERFGEVKPAKSPAAAPLAARKAPRGHRNR